jgi:hypothetical protein
MAAYVDTAHRELKEQQRLLEHALLAASSTEDAAHQHVDHIAWGLNESRDGGPRKAAAPASRSDVLRRYFDAMSDHPDYHERRKQRMSTAKPFAFHERELTRPKSSATRRVEEESQRRLEQEERELRAKFRAHPVPPTTFIPKYEMMVDEWCARKEALRVIAERRAEERQEAERPGREFAAAMQAAKPRHQRKTPDEAHEEWKAKHCKPFVAKTIPKSVIMPRMKEMEVRDADRKARIAARAAELLAVSKHPPRMQRAHSASRPTSPQQTLADAKPVHVDPSAALAARNPEFTFHPAVHPEVPTYEEHWARERLRLELRRQHRPPTVSKEFDGLRTHAVASRDAAQLKANRRAASAQLPMPRDVSPHVAAVLLDMSRDEATLRERRWPYKSSRAKVPPSERAHSQVKPPIATRAHTLKAESAFRGIVSRHETAVADEERAKHRAAKQRLANQRMSQVLVQLGVDTAPPADKIEDETKRKRAATAGQVREYHRQRLEFKERLDTQIPRFLQVGQAGEKLHREAAERAAADSETIALLKKHGLGEKTLRDVMRASHTAQLSGVATDVVTVRDAAPRSNGDGKAPDVITSVAPEVARADPAGAAAPTPAGPPATGEKKAKRSTSKESYSSDSSFEGSSSSSSSSSDTTPNTSRTASP